MALANLYQIFYSQKTKEAIDPGFQPLDNMANERPDWYEFWVIRSFLKNNSLDESRLYAFLSPSFRKKTGIAGADLQRFIGQAPSDVDVVLFSHGWDQIAYFRNVFEQGDYWHPGLMEVSKSFFSSTGIQLDLMAYFGHSMNSVFSNYFAAKPKFWRMWLEIAEHLWRVCEIEAGSLTDALRSSGQYVSGGQEAALKVFVQERIASVLLATTQFQVISLDLSHMPPVLDRLFFEDLRTRKLLSACDTMKLEGSFSNNPFFDEAYEQCRSAIVFRGR